MLAIFPASLLHTHWFHKASKRKKKKKTVSQEGLQSTMFVSVVCAGHRPRRGTKLFLTLMRSKAKVHPLAKERPKLTERR